jgi:hypothetical protein
MIYADSGDALSEATIVARAQGEAVATTAKSDAQGKFNLVLFVEPRTYELTFSHIGFAPQTRSLRVSAADTVATLTIRLVALAQHLAAVQTTAPRLRPMRDNRGQTETPGSSQQALDLSSGLSGDLTGDPTAALAMIPGLTVIPSADGGFTVSAFGLGVDQNGSTLNGVDLGGSSLPRDGLVGVVHLATYDPRVGRFAGIQTNWTLPSGTYLVNRTMHVTADFRSLQFTAGPASALGTRYNNFLMSGTSSGPLPVGKTYFSSALQVSRSTHDIATLAGTGAAALASLGLSRDSVDRLLGLTKELGLTTFPGAGPTSRATTSASAIVRIDLLPAFQFQPLSNSGKLFYLLGTGAVTSASGLGASPLATSSTMATSRAGSGQLVADFEAYLGGALSVTKSSVAVQRSNTTPLVTQPQASVFVGSTLSDSANGATLIHLGGGTISAASIRSQQWETSSDLSWNTFDRRHTFDIFVDAKLNALSGSAIQPQPGVYSFNSIADFAAGRAARFVRSLAAPLPGVSEWDGVLALSDVIGSRSFDGGLGREGLSAQYGLRIEASRFAGPTSSDEGVDSIFARQTTRLPKALALSPMAGFTWKHGQYNEQSGAANFSAARSSLSGGIREYRGTLSPGAVSAVLGESGAAGAAEELDCVGTAVPPPNWNAFASSASAFPSECFGGVLSDPLALRQRPVSFYATNYDFPRSWREEINWQWLFNGQFSGTLGVVNTLNTSQADAFDLNFSGQQRFTLAREGNRPVFVRPQSIDVATGAVAFSDSRLSSEFGHVMEVRSDVRSRQQLLTAGATYRLGTSAFVSSSADSHQELTATLSGSYTYAASGTQTRGFTASTAGDPRELSNGPAGIPRHSIQVILNLQRAQWFSISASGRVNSGLSFTPLVASDINGDGLVNDRAFVFAPGVETEPSVAGLGTLMQQAPVYAKECLDRQIGRIATQASCTGPWYATLGTISIRPDPYRIGLGTRGSATLYINNLLGGIDGLVHRDNRLRGWGQIAAPDPTLLFVRGFDATAARFLYSANPNFGSIATTRRITQTPFRLTLDLRFDVGPNRESQGLRNQFAAPPLGSGVPRDSAGLLQRWKVQISLYRDDVSDILAASAALRLTVAQRDSIDAWRVSLLSARDSIYGALAHYMIGRAGNYDDAVVRKAWHEAVAASLTRSFEFTRKVRASLTNEQYQWLRDHELAPSLDRSEEWLARLIRGPLLLAR